MTVETVLERGALPHRSGEERGRPRRTDAGAEQALRRAFHASVPGYAPTPLVEAPASAAALGVASVRVKDESSRLGLPSYKVLGASWAVRKALLGHAGLPPDAAPTLDELRTVAGALDELALSAATDGNHGRAVARMAALLGLHAQVYVPRETVAARIEAIASEGAQVTVVDGGYDDAVRRSAVDASARCLVISDTSWPGYEDVPGWVVDGYATVFEEIEEAISSDGSPPPHVVSLPVGVGALAAAGARHYAADGAPTLVSVEPTRAACVLASMQAGRLVSLSEPQDSVMAGLNCATPSPVAWPDVEHGFAAYVAVDDARVPAALRLLDEDGVQSGETGAAALAGLLLVAECSPRLLGPAAHLLTLCTEGPTDPAARARLLE